MIKINEQRIMKEIISKKEVFDFTDDCVAENRDLELPCEVHSQSNIQMAFIP